MFQDAYPSSAPWIVAITGASGTIYGRRLLEVLTKHRPEIPLEVVVSDAALRVMRDEEGVMCSAHKLSPETLIGRSAPQIRFHNNKNTGAPIASGSYRASGMVIVPCSMKTLGALSCGLAENLIVRAADVVMKENRRLIVVPRETPLSAIHLENMLKLARMNVSIVPAMPAFYHQPESLAEVIDMMVMRIVDQMGLQMDLATRWGSEQQKDFKTVKRA